MIDSNYFHSSFLGHFFESKLDLSGSIQKIFISCIFIFNDTHRMTSVFLTCIFRISRTRKSKTVPLKCGNLCLSRGVDESSFACYFARTVEQSLIAVKRQIGPLQNYFVRNIWVKRFLSQNCSNLEMIG